MGAFGTTRGRARRATAAMAAAGLIGSGLGRSPGVVTAAPAAAAAGDLDPTFGAAGLLTTDFGAITQSGVADVARLSDGRYVVAGSAALSGGGFDLALTRYNPAGTLDH